MSGSTARLADIAEDYLSKLRKAVATGAVRGRRRVRVIAIRVGIKLSLVTAIFVALGSFAVVAGGISPVDVLAPREPEPPNLLAAAAVPTPDYSTVEPLDLPDNSPIPSATFIRQEIAALPPIVPGTRLTPSQVRVYASIAGWPSGLQDQLLVVSYCESKNRPYATNGVMRGLMQLHPIWFAYSSNSLDDWANPITNLRTAYSVYQYDIARGNAAWAQWQCKPDGTVAPGPVPTPSLNLPSEGPAIAASNGATTAGTTDAPSESPTPTPTPAPWDAKPVWPPSPKGSDTPPTATPAP